MSGKTLPMIYWKSNISNSIYFVSANLEEIAASSRGLGTPRNDKKEEVAVSSRGLGTPRNDKERDMRINKKLAYTILIIYAILLLLFGSSLTFFKLFGL